MLSTSAIVFVFVIRCLLFLPTSACLPTCLSASLPVCQLAHPSVLPVWLPVCQFTNPPVCLPARMPCLSAYLVADSTCHLMHVLFQIALTRPIITQQSVKIGWLDSILYSIILDSSELFLTSYTELARSAGFAVRHEQCPFVSL